MIVLDTNVISACMRPASNRAVIGWLNAQAPESLWTTTVSLFEARYGIECLIGEDRRGPLDQVWRKMAEDIFENRILTFDAAAAQAAALIAAERQKKRRAVDFRDTFIAGICLSRKARLATRNTRDFADAGIPLVDPWKAGKE